MEHHFLHKITSFFPSSLITSSCQSKCVLDVADPLLPFPNLHKIYSLSKTHQPNASKNQSQPPYSKMKISFLSNSGGWFSTATATASECDKENSSESLRLKAEKSFSTRFDNNNNKIIDDLGRRCPSTTSSNSGYSANTLLITRKKPEKYKGYCDFTEPLTELYYSGGRRKTTRGHHYQKRRRKITPADGGILIEESMAVEKRSSDPHRDFWKSMVEMIIEKRIFGVEDLYKLLECFLSLNSPYYHKIILEVFVDICNNLFSS